MFPDFLQRFLPVALPKLSRARAFELALEAAWDEDVAAAEKSGNDPCKAVALAGPDPANPFRKGFLELWRPNGATPALLINTTEASTGRRRVIAPFAFGRTAKGNLEEFEFLPISHDNDVPLSTAASLSARFPWLTPAGYFREEGKDGLRKVRLGDGAYFDNSGVATALDLIDEFEKDMKDPDTGQPLPVDINLIVLTGAGGYSDQKYYGFGELYSPIQSLLAARQANTSSAMRRAIGQIDRIPRAAAETDIGPHIARLRQVLVADAFYPLPLGWRLSNLTQDAIRFQAGDGKRCAPDETSFKQTIEEFFATDCLERVMYHEIEGDDLRQAADTLRVAAASRAEAAAASPLQLGDLVDRPGEAGAGIASAAADRAIVGRYRASVEYAAGKLAPENKSNMRGMFAIYDDKDGEGYRVYFRGLMAQAHQTSHSRDLLLFPDGGIDPSNVGNITPMPNIGLFWDLIQSDPLRLGEDDGAAFSIVGGGSDAVAEGDLCRGRGRSLRSVLQVAVASNGGRPDLSALRVARSLFPIHPAAV